MRLNSEVTPTSTERYLLGQASLLKINNHPGPHVRNVLGKQGMHQTHELASRKYEDTFVLMLGGLVVLASVEGLVLQVEQAQLVGAYDKVVATIRTADLGHARVLGDKASAGTLGPGDAKVLGQVLVFGEARYIDNLGQEASGDERIGDRVDAAGDLLVEALEQAHQPPAKARITHNLYASSQSCFRALPRKAQ
jgi:hypothetical protein